MEDIKNHHQSLLKIIRRKFSHDYVPAEMFTADWLFQNHPYVVPQKVSEDIDSEEHDSMSAEHKGQSYRLDSMEKILP